MEQKEIRGMVLFFEKQDAEAAGQLGRDAVASLQLAHDIWGLAPQGKLRLYLMTSWLRFVFHAAPWPWRLLLGLTFPLWALCVRRLWRIAGGWMQRYGRRLAVGVKAPRLIQGADRRLGEQIFRREESMKEKMRHLACHETTHACSAGLGLPGWLGEGLSMLAVDRLLGKETVRPETAAALASPPASSRSRRYPAYSAGKRDEYVRYYALGYWRVRFLEETRPGLLKELLARKYGSGAWRAALAAAYGFAEEPTWEAIDRLAAGHFRQSGK